MRADPGLVEAILDLSVSLSYSQIANKLGLKSRSVVAGIVNRHAGRMTDEQISMRRFRVANTYGNKFMTPQEYREKAEERRRRDMERLERLKVEHRKRSKARARDSLERKHLNMRADLVVKANQKRDAVSEDNRQRLIAEIGALQMQALPLEGLTRTSCRWIDGDPRGDHAYCGLRARDGSSYCQHHHALAYRGRFVRGL